MVLHLSTGYGTLISVLVYAGSENRHLAFFSKPAGIAVHNFYNSIHHRIVSICKQSYSHNPFFFNKTLNLLGGIPILFLKDEWNACLLLKPQLSPIASTV